MGEMPTKPAFYLDVQACTGCKTCMAACKDKNDLEPGVRWRRVVEYSGGRWLVLPDGTFKQDVFAYYLSVSCNHCAEPICVAVCPTTAMHQDEHGIVTVDQDKCMGCGYCKWACPYDAPQYLSGRGVMSKCDFCRDTIMAGGEPVCVSACPTRALHFGEFDELRHAAGDQKTMAPLPDPEFTIPNAIFGPHRMSQPFNDAIGFIANPEENKDA